MYETSSGNQCHDSAGSRIYLRNEVTLFYQVNIPGKGEGDEKVKKANLSGATIPNAEDLTVSGIAKYLDMRARSIRDGKDKEMNDSMKPFKIMPWWFVKYYLDFASWLIYGLNLI